MSKKQRILVVDDERIYRKTLSDILEENLDVIVAKNGEQALKRVRDDPDIDLIILDIMMPGMDGLEVLLQLKKSDDSINIPVIFITAMDSPKDEVCGLKLGAVDYINKPFHPEIVKLRVENHLRFVRQRRLLETLVGLDGLTEIANRRCFDETLKNEWQRSKRTKSPLSLAMIDVDYFKHFNDNYGHPRGDTVLKSVANTLTNCLHRLTDLAARYGGEEFVLLFPDTEAVGAETIAEKVRIAIGTLDITHNFSEIASHVTVSIGGTTMIATDDSPRILIEAADAMLYEAKETGRNKVVWGNNNGKTSLLSS